MSAEALVQIRSDASRRLLVNLVLLVIVIGFVTYVLSVLRDTDPDPGVRVPRSAALEELTGVRVSRVAVVGDGGLVLVDYVVLDPEKATRFQADREHTPALASESRDLGTRRASIMRAGHLMRPGQTYYLVYQNTANGLRPGETMTLTYHGVSLHHIPVL